MTEEQRAAAKRQAATAELAAAKADADRWKAAHDGILVEAARVTGEVSAELAASQGRERVLREALRWRGMDTAPRDGTRILVAFQSHGVLAVAWEEAASGIEIWCVDDFKFGPYAVRGYIETDVIGWMPLPALATPEAAK